MRCIVALAALAGCWSSTPTPRTPTPQDPIVATSGGPSRYAAALEDPLGFLPADSTLALDVDVAHLREAPLFTHYAPQLKQVGNLASLIPSACFDLYDTLEGITIGMTWSTVDDVKGVAVMRGVNLPQMRDCLKNTPNTEVHQLSPTRLSTTSLKNTGYLEWVEPRTVVTYYGKGGSAADLDRALADALKPHRGGTPLAEAFANITGTHTAWFVMLPNAAMQQPLAAAGIAPDVAFATFDIDAALAIDAHLRLDTAASATALEQKANAQLSMLHGWFERLDVRAADRDLVIDLKATQANIDSLVGMFGGMFGGGGMGSGSGSGSAPQQQVNPFGGP